MSRTPVFRILRPERNDATGGRDITARFTPYFKRLELQDHAGGRADSVKLMLVDDGVHELPIEGEELNIGLGYQDDAHELARGLFAIDQIAYETPPASIIFSATGANFVSAAREKRDRTHEPTTLGELLHTLAAPHGYQSRVIPQRLANLQLPLIDQAGQTDLGLADELARTYGGIFKPVDGAWVILGYDMLERDNPTVTLRPGDVTDLRAHFMPRRAFASATAHWHDYAAAQRTPVTVGSGTPNRLLDRTYKTAAIARAHAAAVLAKGQRQSRRLQITMPGRPDLSTHTVLRTTGFRPRVDDAWLITQVTHTLDKRGYRCRIEAEGV